MSVTKMGLQTKPYQLGDREFTLREMTKQEADQLQQLLTERDDAAKAGDSKEAVHDLADRISELVLRLPVDKNAKWPDREWLTDNSSERIFYELVYEQVALNSFGEALGKLHRAIDSQTASLAPTPTTP